MSLEAALASLARDGRLSPEAWPDGEDPQRYGLEKAGGYIVPAATFEALRPERIRQGLSRRAGAWIRELEVHPVIGSTNTTLMERAQRQAIDGIVCLAELQLEGRGRRGRSWTSPFGANLAVSLGMAVDRPPAALGGVSLVAGLAVMDALDQLGIGEVALKWPNDVLLGGAKLGGILIEMSRTRGTELVVGVGVNVRLSDHLRSGLPQGVADLAHLSPLPSRNALASAIVSSIVEFVNEFEGLGFGPFMQAFDARHYYHEKACQIVQGDLRIAGTVRGVTGDGELLLQTAQGPRAFHAGEVSLRPET